ncbi:flagellar M-ring protein FliF C-terminal domain-containing protein [Actinoplanes sp. NPDC026670]|uniref:flagellar M-ring protein FliF C-terminal domain-containing protein n=1 Tax=Actinoplanes sp. NPDC026670 TaxID=3154700 RepID=UPI0033BFFD45
MTFGHSRAAFGILASAALAVVLAGAPAPAAPRSVTGNDTATAAFQDRLDTSLQGMLDTLVGPGRAVVTTTAELDFSRVESVSTTYTRDPSVGAKSERLTNRIYTSGGTRYESSSTERANALNSVRESRRNAPGTVKKLNIAVLIDTAASQNIDLAQLRNLVSTAAGADPGRGDMVAVSALPFQPAEAPAAIADGATPPSRYALPIAGLSGLLLLILALAIRRRRSHRAQMSLANDRLRQARAQLERRPPIAAEAVATPATESRPDALNRQHTIQQLTSADPDRAAAVLRGWTAGRR